MSKQDEAFEKWHADNYGPRCHRIRVSDERYDIARDAFAAGREAEREQVLGIIAELKTSHEQTLEPQRPMFNMPINVYINACDEITRRIKEQEK